MKLFPTLIPLGICIRIHLSFEVNLFHLDMADLSLRLNSFIIHILLGLSSLLSLDLDVRFFLLDNDPEVLTLVSRSGGILRVAVLLGGGLGALAALGARLSGAGFLSTILTRVFGVLGVVGKGISDAVVAEGSGALGDTKGITNGLVVHLKLGVVNIESEAGHDAMRHDLTWLYTARLDPL